MLAYWQFLKRYLVRTKSADRRFLRCMLLPFSIFVPMNMLFDREGEALALLESEEVMHPKQLLLVMHHEADLENGVDSDIWQGILHNIKKDVENRVKKVENIALEVRMGAAIVTFTWVQACMGSSGSCQRTAHSCCNW